MSFALTIHFLRDALTTLCVLNKLFQCSTIRPIDVQEKIIATIDALQGRYLGETIIWGSSVVNFEENETLKLLVEDTRKFIKRVVANVQARFPESKLILTPKSSQRMV